MQRTIQNKAGFTLLEIMVALVIFSVGLLGLAGLQANGMRANKTADLRTIAIIQSHDMAERIRANNAGLRAGDYDDIDATPLPGAPGTNCFENDCTSSQLATWDIYEWQNQLDESLPSGRGSINRPDDDSPFVITVMWDEAGTGATGEDCSGDAAVDLKCYRMEFLP